MIDKGAAAPQIAFGSVTMKILWACLALLLAGCAVGGGDILQRGDQAIIAGHYTYAYASWRTAWITGSPELGQQAVVRTKLYPKVVEAGEESLIDGVVSAAQSESSGRPGALRALLDAPDFRRYVAFHKLVKPEFDDARLEALAEESLAARARRAKEDEARRLADAKRHEAFLRDIADARRAAGWICTGPTCEKAFALAQIFVDRNADMKIQVATNTIVETYNPTDSGKVGLKIVKMPLRGDESEVRLTVICKDGHCGPERELAIYRAFPAFMRARLAP
jgi:hypothetical protein